LNDNVEEPIPSFLKALTSYHSELSIEAEDNEVLNETFSKSSG
jgi:hypothetical protein